MFNLYYINYAKAFEIAMQIDNKLLDKIVRDHDMSFLGNGGGDLDTKGTDNVPILGKLLPRLNANLALTASKTSKTSDTINVITTKSTILNSVIQKAIEVKKIDDNRIGNLIKIKNVSLAVQNAQDIITTKALLGALLKQVTVEGMGAMDLTGLAESFLKGAAYILSGQMPERVKTDPSSSKLLIKIPMQMESEMESQYSISDVEIGPVTVVGIYRGKYRTSDIRCKIDALTYFKSEDVSLSELETDISKNDDHKGNENAHFVDVIAIIQELNI